jgi:hypothetical protein
MTFFPGRKPALIYLLALLCTMTAQAQQRVPLTLAEAEDLALSDEPGYAALLARAEALTEHDANRPSQLPD